MTAIATREAGAVGLERREAPHLFEPEELTLEETILRACEELQVEGHVACPVCGGSMSAGSGCADCGSELE
jgi:hypothetical protein